MLVEILEDIHIKDDFVDIEYKKGQVVKAWDVLTKISGKESITLEIPESKRRALVTAYKVREVNQ